MGLCNFNGPESRRSERSGNFSVSLSLFFSLLLPLFFSFFLSFVRSEPLTVNASLHHAYPFAAFMNTKKRSNSAPQKKCHLVLVYFCTSSPQILSSSCAGENPTNVCPSAVRSTFTRTSASVSEPDFRSVAIVLNASDYSRVTR